MEVIFYSIFSQSLGTVEKTVLELLKKVRSTNLEEPDQISLKCTWISEKQVKAHFGCNDEVSQLSSNVAQRQQRQHSALSNSLRRVKPEPFDCCICDPRVIIVTDHDSFWRPRRSACVNEGTTVAWFGLVHSVLKGIFLFFRIVLGHSDFHELVPGQNFAFHLGGYVFRY